MGENNTGGSGTFGFGKPSTPAPQQTDNSTSPVEGTNNEHAAITEAAMKVLEANDTTQNEDTSLSYTDNRSVTISLVTNYSLYRRANDKVIPKKTDYIGSSISASRTLSANKEEIETYFPTLLGIAHNNPEFVTRIKQYLNNIRASVDGNGLTFNTTFVYKHKSDYYKIVAQEQEIENEYNRVPRKDTARLRIALKEKITKLNNLESTKYAFGYPLVLEDYLLYRHCLLYNDVAKDLAFINIDANIRFYFKDDQKEAERDRKHRNDLNKAKVNYVSLMGDNDLFETVYIQYLVDTGAPVIAGLAEKPIDKERKLDLYSTSYPVKFNEMVSNKDSRIIGTIEKLIAHGELVRSLHNQNINSEQGHFIGSNMKEAVAWFKSPDNATMVNTYINRLNNT